MANKMMRIISITLVTLFLLGSTATADHQSEPAPPTPITVEPVDFTDLTSAFEPWHQVASRRVFVEQSGGYVQWERNFHVPWTDKQEDSCTIHLRSQDEDNIHIIRHELGHCLGFEDHTTSNDQYDREGLKVCDDPNHPNYSPYQGVMSYCGFSSQLGWWENDDKQMMAAATYEPSPWAAEVWQKAEDAGVITEHSDPHATITKQELMAFFDRAGLLD